MRKFEKISFEQFKKDVCNNESLYNNIKLPQRSTKHSAGYDICSLEESIVKPGESKIFTTGLKVCMNSDEVFFIISRSSQGYKYDVCLTNCVGVIDSDFYNNPENEGHFKIKLSNNGNKDYIVKIGDKIAQGIFIKYLTVDNEEDILNSRSGGIGSTDKR